jgi:hypothetical protein
LGALPKMSGVLVTARLQILCGKSDQLAEILRGGK